jgi:hypothetical protein
MLGKTLVRYNKNISFVNEVEINRKLENSSNKVAWYNIEDA